MQSSTTFREQALRLLHRAWPRGGRLADRVRWAFREARRIAREAGVPVSEQALRYVEYAVCTGVDLPEFYWSGLWSRSARPAHEILSGRRFHRRERQLNPPPYRIVAAHKYLMHRLLEEAGVPRPRLLGLLHPHGGFTADGGPLRSAADLERFVAQPGLEPVFKPTRGHKGKGVLVCRALGGGRLRTLDGDVLDAAALHALLLSSAPEWIVEERVRPHAFFARYAEATSKARIVTLLRDSDVRVIAAGLSIAVAGQMAVNNDSGALLTGVDLATGELEDAILLRDTRVRTHHPCGVPIRGERVPAWEAALDTALRAQRAIPWLRSLGWDIALDEAGVWRVLEANVGWGVPAVQALSRRGLLAGPLGEELRLLRRR